MGFNLKQEDRIDAVAYTSSHSAQAVFEGLDPENEYSHIMLYKDIADTEYGYGNTYKVIITIEPA